MNIRTKLVAGLIAGTVLIAFSMTAATHPGIAPHTHEVGFWEGLAHPFGWLGSLAALISLGLGLYFVATGWRSSSLNKGRHEYQREDDQPGKQR